MSTPSNQAYLGPFTGRYSDGKTAGVAQVSILLTDRGIEMTRSAGVEPLVWPYDALRAATPLSRGGSDALISYTFEPGATLFVPSAVFAHEISQRAPQITTRAARWNSMKPLLALTAVIALIVGAVYALDLSPARAVAKWMPEEARHRLGENVIQSMTQGRKVCDLPSGRAALDKMMLRLGKGASGEKYSIVVSDWGLVNAFASPGENIVITRGLINKAESADEVAGVIAHEMGHGLERHPETAIVRAIGLSAATELILGGSSSTLANVGILLAQIGYTRTAEAEADQRAIELLKAAEISPKGLGDFFKRVDKLEGEMTPGKMKTAFDMIRTHPPSLDRARMVEQQGPYPSTPALSQEEWVALRAICGTRKPDDKPDDDDL